MHGCVSFQRHTLHEKLSDDSKELCTMEPKIFKNPYIYFTAPFISINIFFAFLQTLNLSATLIIFIKREYKGNFVTFLAPICRTVNVTVLFTLDSGINIGVRLLIVGLFSRDKFLITEVNAYFFSKYPLFYGMRDAYFKGYA